MVRSKGNLSPHHKLILGLLILLPLLIVLGKCSFLPTSDFLTRTITLDDVPHSMYRRLQYVLFVPLGAILVCLCRLTLGIRVLGPFRSILLGAAFRITGVVNGLVFLAIAIAVIVGIRPTLKTIKLPYFARVSVILSLVSVLIISTMILGNRLGDDSITKVAYFPIIVLCLVGDAFSRILVKEGARSVFWRTGMTIVVALILTFCIQMPSLLTFLLKYPELLVTQIGLIVVIAEYFDLRLLQWMNPGVDEESDGAVEDRHDPQGSGNVNLAA
ncbi:MAG: hypothetical protein GX621_06365 [Pirellulaceae bacterium]|nr:hypothetical protein [Pirellulaceae bacterium]